MSAWGQLLLGLGSFITAITGLLVATYAVHKSRKEPREAAQHTADHLLYPPSEERAVLQHALDLLLHEHPHHELSEGHAGHDELQAHREQHHGEAGGAS